MNKNKEKRKHIDGTNQPPESSYLNTRSLTEFHSHTTQFQHTFRADFELVLPLKFKDTNGKYLHLEDWLPLNNPFGKLINTLQVNRKRYELKMIPSISLGSVSRYSTGIMQHIRKKQLAATERDFFFL